MQYEEIGMRKWDIDTPAMLVDLPAMERNIAVMADFAKRHKVNLRPHVKTHKSTILAGKQLAAGASGICCAKLGEAAVMADAGMEFIKFSPADADWFIRTAYRSRWDKMEESKPEIAPKLRPLLTK